MKVAKPWLGSHESGISFHCPGCDQRHSVRTVGNYAWGWNGSVEKPTLTPSVMVTGVVPLTAEEHTSVMRGEPHEPVPFVCHSCVTDGRIQFLGDCTHALAGQVVDLPELLEKEAA